MIYLDNAASTRCDDIVVTAMLPFFTDKYANSGNINNPMGGEANSAIVQSRNIVAKVLGCLPQKLIWTAGATEANNIAILGTFAQLQKERGDKKFHIVVSSIEHKSVLEPLLQLHLQGVQLTFVEPDSLGQTTAQRIIDAVNDQTAMICLMLANNELGVINAIDEVAEYCSTKGIFFHCDATQAVGKIPIDLKKIKVDTMSLSGHKFHGPKGVGVLFIRNEDQINPIMFGGGQENRLRSGTLNVPGIVGLSTALTIANDRMHRDSEQIAALRDKLELILLNNDPSIIINGYGCPRLPNISNITFLVRPGHNLLEQIAEHGLLACSSGSACDTADNRPSHVMKALGRSRHDAKNTLRFSLSRFTTQSEIEEAALHLTDLFNKMRY